MPEKESFVYSMNETGGGLKRESERKNIATAYIDLTRHGNRFGGAMELEFYDGSVVQFDDTQNLTPEGKENARKFGAGAYPDAVTLAHPRGGDEARHGESGEDILAGSQKFGGARRELGPATVRDGMGRVKGARRGRGLDYKSSGIMKDLLPLREFIIGKLRERVLSFSPDEQDRIRESAELRAKYREQAQVEGLKKAMENPEMIRKLAENEAYELMHDIELTRRGVKGGETKAVTLVGSGLFAESLFKHALVVEDERTGERKVGFENVDEIGGLTKQATAVRLKLERDLDKKIPSKEAGRFLEDTTVSCEFTDPERAKLFAGKKISLDWDKVRKLAAAAESRFKNYHI